MVRGMERDLNERMGALQEFVPECKTALWDMLREASLVAGMPRRYRERTYRQIGAFAVVLNVPYETMEEWVTDIAIDHFREWRFSNKGDLDISLEQYVLDFLYPES